MSVRPSAPLRWRRISRPIEWSSLNSMSQFIWNRDHSGEVELTRDGKVLATARPDGRWTAHGLGGSGKAADKDAAKVEALAFVRKALADAKAGAK